MPGISEILDEEIESGKSPSVQYYLFNSDSILQSYQKGFADIKEQRQVDSNTTYNAFSVTKTFTALAILQLAERGKLDINQSIINYLPDFPYGTEITVKQILNHAAGIPNPVPLSWIHLASEQKAFNRDAFFKNIFDKNNKVKSNPNEKYAYSNLGYVILGKLIEKVTGQTYERYVSENIINKLPIGTNDLSFLITDSNVHAKGYQKKMSLTYLTLGFFIDKSKFMGETEGKWRSFKKFYVNGASYGGLIGKPTAFVKYIQELLKDKSNLISEEYKQLLFQENKNNKNENTGVCLSWFKGSLNGVNYFAHAGGGGGYYCEIRIYPEVKIGSVIFFNRTGVSDKRYLDKLDKFYINARQ